MKLDLMCSCENQNIFWYWIFELPAEKQLLYLVQVSSTTKMWNTFLNWCETRTRESSIFFSSSIHSQLFLDQLILEGRKYKAYFPRVGGLFYALGPRPPPSNCWSETEGSQFLAKVSADLSEMRPVSLSANQRPRIMWDQPIRSQDEKRGWSGSSKVSGG